MSHDVTTTQTTVGTQGAALRTICRTDTPEEFESVCLFALEKWAKALDIPNPGAIVAHLHHHRFRAVTGATEAQKQQLYTQLRDELGCDKIHPSRPQDTLSSMIRFYYCQLHKKWQEENTK